MANEISAAATLRLTNGLTTDSKSVTFNADQAGNAYQAGVQTVGTSEETIVKGDVGTIGFVWLRNTDATNYVEFGSTTGVYDTKLKAGEASIMRWNGTNVLAKANTSSVEVEYLIVEN